MYYLLVQKILIKTYNWILTVKTSKNIPDFVTKREFLKLAANSSFINETSL